MKVTVVVPAYNEASVISSVLHGLQKELRKLGAYEIVVIDDGSSDDTAQQAMGRGVTVLQHPINRGLGGALGTGFAYAKKTNAEILVTFDADGQHDPADLHAVVRPIREGTADVVIGSRTIKSSNKIPWDRKFVIWGSNLLTRLLFSIPTTDSQSGFRAFSRHVIRQTLIKTQEMEVSSEFFSEFQRLGLRVVEVPINVRYTPYSRRKGQSNLNALSILVRLLLRLAR